MEFDCYSQVICGCYLSWFRNNITIDVIYLSPTLHIDDNKWYDYAIFVHLTQIISI